MDIKKRYKGIQTTLLHCGETGCLFLALMSIVEEFLKKPCDLINCINVLRETNCIEDNFYVNDSLMMLSLLTGKRWHRRESISLPDVIKENEFTIEKWYNPRTNFTHFRRRGFDSLANSITVREGKLQEYYIYWYDQEAA